MKFTIAVVVLALAVAAQASVIPLGWAGLVAAHHGHEDGSWHGDNAWEDGHWDPSHDLVHDHGLAHAWGVHGHHGLVAGHGIVDAHGLLAGHHLVAGHGLHGHGLPVVDVHHAHHAHHAVPILAHAHHEGSYVAANRGSVHVAPLAGHIQSASSINLQPAPGTL